MNKEKQALLPFTEAMLNKLELRKSRYKELGWRDKDYKSRGDLNLHLIQEVSEWTHTKSRSNEELEELVDIANCCFMLYDRITNDRKNETNIQ